MSFFLSALVFAVVVGIMRGLSLATERSSSRARAATALPCTRPTAAVQQRRAA